MSESPLHISLKQIVAAELQKLGFQVRFEPEEPPKNAVKWRSYRPDLIGVLSRPGETHFAIVECETRPSGTRFARKNWREIEFQSKLFEDTLISFILAVPIGSISKATSFRRKWEVWQINTITNELWKIPRCETGASQYVR